MNKYVTNLLVDFTRWVQEDPDVKLMAANACRKFDVATFGVLAIEHEEAFLELYEAAADLREQAPVEHRPGFLR